MFGIIYVIVPRHINLTRKVMVIAKYFIYYMATVVKLLHGLLINFSEYEIE